jgi:hypothetical protein
MRWWGRTRLSPARRRRGDGDDKRALPVSRCGRSYAEMGRRQRNGSAGPDCGPGLQQRKGISGLRFGGLLLG